MKYICQFFCASNSGLTPSEALLKVQTVQSAGSASTGASANAGRHKPKTSASEAPEAKRQKGIEQYVVRGF